jgi:hypothetical protein
VSFAKRNPARACFGNPHVRGSGAIVRGLHLGNAGARKRFLEATSADAGVRTQLLNVVVSGGVVHVWGVVATPEEKAAVRAAAESAPGVKEVRADVDAVPSYVRPFIRGG